MTVDDHETFLRDIDRPPAMRSEREVRKLGFILDQIAAEDAERVRKRCIQLLQGSLGNGGIRAFLNCPQPAYDDLTGDQILTRDPQGLLARLEEIERGAGE